MVRFSKWLGREGFGSKSLPWIGGAVTLLGVLLLMMLAIDRGWIGPVARVCLAAGLGVGLIGLALWLRRGPTSAKAVALSGPAVEEHGPFALAATGFVILYIDVVAATTILSLMPPVVGILVALAIALCGLALANRWSSQRLAMFVLIAAALSAPWLTLSFTVLLVAFLIVLLVSTIPVYLVHRWPGALLSAGIPPLVAASLACLLYDVTEHDPALAVASITVAAALLVAATVVVALLFNTDMGVAGLILVLSTPVPVMLTAMVVEQWAAVSFIAGVGLVMLIMWAVNERIGLDTDIKAAFGTAAAVLMFHATVAATDPDEAAFALLGEGLVLAVLTVRVRRIGPLFASYCFAIVGFFLALDTLRFDMLIYPVFTLLDNRMLIESALIAVLITITAGMIVYAAVSFRYTDLRRAALPAIGGAFGVIVLHGSVGIIVAPAMLISTDRTGFLTGHALVTIMWTLLALVLLVRGIQRRPVRLIGFVLVAAALIKLVLFDLASLDGIARAGAFLGAGLVLLTAGVRYTRLVSAAKQESEDTVDAHVQST